MLLRLRLEEVGDYVANYDKLLRLSLRSLSAVMIRIISSSRLLGVSFPPLIALGAQQSASIAGGARLCYIPLARAAPGMTRSGVPRPSDSAGGGNVGGQSDYLS